MTRVEAYKNGEGRTIVRDAVSAIYGECPVPAESRILQSDSYGDIHVLAVGKPENPPLILLHGSSGNSSGWFGMLCELLDDFRIYLVDLPGQPGLSSSGRLALGDGSMVGWMDELMTLLGLKRVSLAGKSLGAWLSMAYAVAYPDRVTRVAVISPSGIRPPKPGFLFRILPLAFCGRPGQKRIFELIHGPVPIYRPMLDFAGLVSRHFRPLTETPPIFSDAELLGFQAPLLLIGGDRDVMLDMPGSAERVERLVPDSRVILRKGYSHVLPDEGAVLAEFFS